MMQTKEILSLIKNLRYFSGKESEFWQEYLKGVSLLTKSKFCFSINFKDDKYKVISKTSIIEDTQIEEILKGSQETLSRAIENSFSYEPIRFSWIQSRRSYVVFFTIESQDDTKIVALVVEKENSTQFNELLLRTQLISDVYLSYIKNQAKPLVIGENVLQDGENEAGNDFKNVLEVVSLMTKQNSFLLACMTLVNELSVRFDATTVNIGWEEDGYVKPIAISHLEKFNKNTDAIHKLEAVFEESFDQDEEIIYPDNDKQATIVYAHSIYHKDKNLSQIVTMPLRIDNESIGVVCFEKVDGSFTHLEIISMRLIANQVIRILKHLYEMDMNIFKKIKYKAKKHLKWWLGVNNTLIKLVSLGVFIFFVYSLLASWEYKVESTASLTTDSVSLVCAPYDGIVFDVLASSGDKVSKDDLLMKLDTKELFLKFTESSADMTRFKAQAQKARADNKLADMNMANARVKQVSAELEKIKYYLKQADVKSPFDGIVVKGDKEELLGAPVSKGEKLFQIAQLSDFYLTIHVEESYIDEIEVAQKGELKLLSRPDEVIPFVVDKIIPMANVDSEQKNSFIVKAKFVNQSDAWWRSGMSGVAKVNIGEKSVYWILTHKFVNFLRMYFWI